MDQVIIDQKRCVGCGACAQDCPVHAITMTEGKAEWKQSCILCGHCVAICPVFAVSIPEYDMGDVEEYERESFSVAPETYLRAVKFRRSIRRFREEAIPKEMMETILQAGRYTATAKNLQATTFVVVTDRLREFKELFWNEFPEILETVRRTKPEYVRPFTMFYKVWQKDPSHDIFFFNATSLLVIAAEDPLDGGLAAANIENMAVAKGAGALYSGYLQRTVSADPVLMEWLGLAGRSVACCMLLGYPAVAYKRTAPRRMADVRWK